MRAQPKGTHAAVSGAGDGPGAHGGTGWQELLAGAGPREVLARLVDGDPLGLWAVVRERLRARAYLLDADRVFLRSLARVARYAPRYRGEPELEVWLAGIVDEALLDLLEEEREGGAGPTLGPDAVRELARPLGLDPAAMRAACRRFHELPEGERRTFQALLVEGRELDELARSTGESATAVARRARHALLTVILRNAAPLEAAHEGTNLVRHRAR
jgi:DNA-directed RNA polymerase specialized sigma24 family protein